MRKIAMIATREFIAAATNKGFVIGVVLVPTMIVAVVAIFPFVSAAIGGTLRGDIAIIDRSGQVVGDLRAALDPRAVAARRAAAVRRFIPGTTGGSGVAPTIVGEASRAVSEGDNVNVHERPSDADADRERAWLLEESTSPRLALIVVHPDAVTPAAGRDQYGSYDLYVPAYASRQSDDAIRGALEDAIVAARLRVRSLAPTAIEQLTTVAPGRSLTVTKSGIRQTQREFDLMLPVVFVTMLSVGIVLSGHTLLTSTVEEKSNRIVELLLSSVTPFELMAGKLVGHLGVTILILALHISLALVVLFSFALIGLLDPWLVLYFMVFLFVTYLMFGAGMIAVGAAVDDMHEAQSLAGPLMMAALAPAFLIPSLTRDASSTLSVVLSFVPPVNTFAMMGRLTSTSPPPAWQVWITIAIGLAAAAGMTWFAAKIFKVGLLMHGKPPNLATLIRWAKAA
ncbi:MAG TPA: ABC transporter permease [Vicinamibacterales bacterium]|nr:ABC transporter permease [Vicinamibacterales bacterium]